MQETTSRKIRMKRPRSAGRRRGNSATSYSRQANTRGWRQRNIWIGSPTRTFVCSDKSNSALQWRVCRKSAVPSRGTRRSHGPGECVLPLNSMRCSARPYPVSAAPNASGRSARTSSGPATVGIAGIHSILADSARTAAISGKSRGVFSVEKCLRIARSFSSSPRRYKRASAMRPRSAPRTSSRTHASDNRITRNGFTSATTPTPSQLTAAMVVLAGGALVTTC